MSDAAENQERERFFLKADELREAVEGRRPPGLHPFNVLTDSDDLASALRAIAQAGILEAPPGLEIVIYPDSPGEADRALVTVLSVRRPFAHVAASSDLIFKEAEEGESDVERTVDAVKSVVDSASVLVPAVRLLEHQLPGWGIHRRAACPRCGQADQLRVEYRHDVLGLDAEGGIVPGDPERTDLFCLACRNEVERAVPFGAAPPGAPS